MLAAAAPAQAEWLQATSRHFVVYADTDERSLRRQAAELEQFDAVLRRSLPAPDAEAEFNRVTVFVLPRPDAVEKMSGRRNVAGFYVPRVTGSIAFTPRANNIGSTSALTPRVVLFHEYTHHYLLGSFAEAYPAWFSEGFAEYAATLTAKGDTLWLGSWPAHRGYGLFNGRALSMRQLLDPPAKLTGEQLDAIYGRGWLLTHYLLFDPARRGQLARYLGLIGRGKPPVEAGTEAFGDLRALDDRLDAYLARGSVPSLKIDPKQLPVPSIAVRPLTAGEQALIEHRMVSSRGVDKKTAGPLFAKARAAAAAHRTDAVAQGWLAEMAFDAGDLDAAEAAADAALAADAASGQALLYKARVLLARAKAAKAAAPVWTQARQWIVKANRASPNDAAALALYYDSFGMEGSAPTKAAVAGLHRAVELVPQDPSLRMQAATRHVLDGDKEEARRLLRTVAYDPHAGAEHPARKLLAALDAGRSGAAALEGIGPVKSGED
jgi:tetratricopeptide (TPR) repeat protein